MLLLWWSTSILFGMHKDLIPVTKTAPLFVNITCSCPPSIAISTLKAAEYALLDVITSQDKWRPLIALVWQNPTIQRIVPPAFSAGEDEISVSPPTAVACCLTNRSLTPHGEKYVVKRTKKGTDCRFIPQPLIQNRTLFLVFKVPPPPRWQRSLVDANGVIN